ncbi:hypothetical protein [Candidatus Palauibacter sp.]|uniref:hypothetical protein n=1 Tax=Candidatus Palauibacter sp. TaxID=3101350 RepID=UPI003B52836E
MRLLVDSDAFCKLAVSGLLSDAAALFNAELGECGRLPALTHMLRRGQLRQTYGATACDGLIPLAESMPSVVSPPTSWLEQLTLICDVDPGEAILFATAADRRIPVLTGDIRSLRALKNVDRFPEALEGRVAVLEAVLVGLCGRLGTAAVRARVESVPQADTVIRICFSPGVEEPELALRSYLGDRRRELAPLVLWGADEEEV